METIKVQELLNFCGISSFVDVENVSDGSHSYLELYNHRDTLFLALASILYGRTDSAFLVFKSKLHQDGTNFEGYFLLMLVNQYDNKQISYHLDINKYWDIAPGEDMTDCYEELPKFDGHSSDDVLERLLFWFVI